eukprot:scaffold326231_cov138-Tisochrysis_lutea.AAC.1
MEREVLGAFRCLQAGANIGKVVVRLPALVGRGVRGVHLLSGGSGGLGVLTGRWLAEAGAEAV